MMYPSVSDFTRLKRLQPSTNYILDGQVKGEKDLVSSSLGGCAKGNLISTKKTDMGLTGKLKTVREVSKVIDFKAAQSQNFLLYSQYSGDATNPTSLIQVPTYDAAGNLTGYTAGTEVSSRGGFGRQINQIQLNCSNTGQCLSQVLTKVGKLKLTFLNRNRL